MKDNTQLLLILSVIIILAYGFSRYMEPRAFDIFKSENKDESKQWPVSSIVIFSLVVLITLYIVYRLYRK